MSYATRSDVEQQFGEDNVSKWADLNNTDNSTKIAARIDWALSQSYALLNSRLRYGHYEIPFASPYPAEVVYIQAMWAGILLFDGRMVTDAKKGYQLTAKHDELRRLVRQLHRGQLKLDVEVQGTNIPKALVAAEEEAEAEDDSTT